MTCPESLKMRARLAVTVPLILLGIFILNGCTPTVPKEALKLQPDTLALRQLQSRVFDTKNEKDLLMAGATLLQDMGFHIDDTDTSVGVLVGSKDTDARETGEIVGAIFIGVIIGAEVPWAATQKIKASLVTKPVSDKRTSLRVTFQRIVWNNKGVVHKVEGLRDEILYRDFFEKLSKSVFLEAHEL